MQENPPLCDECVSIRQELAEAYAKEWAAADRATRDAWSAVWGMIGGSEEDAERAEELSARATIKDRPRIRTALMKAMTHTAQTGHRIPLRPPEMSW
jgi:hypothetical protein